MKMLTSEGFFHFWNCYLLQDLGPHTSGSLASGFHLEKKGNIINDRYHVFMDIRSFGEQIFRIQVDLKDFHLTAVISEPLSEIVSFASSFGAKALCQCR